MFHPKTDYAGSAMLECPHCYTPHMYDDWAKIWERPASRWVCFVRHLRYVMEEHGRDPIVLEDDPKTCTVYLPMPHDHALNSFARSVDVGPDAEPEALWALAKKIYDEYRRRP